jgi:peptidyl-prolyl cis-trans isomerase C
MTVTMTLRPLMAAVSLTALVAVGTPAAAQDASADAVVATVDGREITESDLAVGAQSFVSELSQIPQQNRRQALIDALIDIELLARAAEAEGVDEDPIVKQRLSLVRDRALRAEYLRSKVFEAVTDEMIQQRFDEEMQSFEPADEISASHILLATEEEAQAVIDELDAGGDFAAIAGEKSLDPGSNGNGGSLGFFQRGQMVGQFEDAAFALAEVGDYTEEPVKSNFGWHVIRLDDRRAAPPPTLAQEQARIAEDLAREMFTAEIDKVRAAATIEIVQPEPAADEAPAEEDAPAEAESTE